MLIVYLHDTCIDNYRKFSEAKYLSKDLKEPTTDSFERELKLNTYLFEKNKMKKLNNILTILYESSILQEQYEKKQEVLTKANQTELELFVV